MIERYCKILGVSSSATLSEIKKAFRKKAKLYHPDISKHPNASELFRLINEAYEYLHDVKTGKVPPARKLRTERARTTSSQETARSKAKREAEERRKYGRSSRRWTAEQRAAARERVQAEKIRAERVYRNSKEGKYKNAALSLGIWLFSIIPILIIVLAVSISIYFAGAVGGIAALVFSSPFWFVVYKNSEHYRFTGLKAVLSTFFSHSKTYKYATLIVSILMTLAFTLKTAFVPIYLLLSYVVVAAGLVAISKTKLIKVISLRFILIGLTPFLISLFFWVNYSFASHEQTSLYRFKWDKIQSNRIAIEGGKYNDSPWLRTFFNFSEIKGAEIRLDEAEGFFGLPVIKSFEFTNRYWWMLR